MNIRYISIGVMGLAVLASVLLRPEIPSGNFDKLDEKKNHFMVKMPKYQAIATRSLPDDQKKQANEQIQNFFLELEKQSRFSKTLAYDKFLILNFIGADTSFPSFEGELQTQLETLYIKKTPLSPDAALFSLTAGDLARLKQYDIMSDLKKKEELYEKLEQDAVVYVLSLYAILGFLFILIVLSPFLITFFLKNPGTPIFADALRNAGEPGISLLESSVLYLFLLFSIGTVASKFIPSAYILYFQLLLIPAILAGTVFYYYRNTLSLESVKVLFYSQKLSLEDFLKEAVWGILGYAALFPMALLAIMLMAGSGLVDSGPVRFAHPIIFVIEENFFIVFLLAVVFVPFAEEVVFRSMMYGFFRQRLRILYSAFLTGGIFAILHPQGFIAFPALALLGSGLAILREFRKSIIAPTVTHMMVNATSLIGAYFVLKG